MPDDVKISEMSEAASLDNSAQFPYVQSMNGNLTTLKAPLSQIGTKINEGMTFSNLQTTSKTIVGAINEAAQAGGVEYATELPISSTDPTNTKEYIDTKTTLVKSASGSIIHITDGGDNIPMKSLESEIVAVESGSGTKSPTNPYTISGFDSGVVTRCGKNLFDKTNNSIILESFLSRTGDTYIITSSTNVFTAFVRCKANTSYTVSKLAGSRFIIGWTKELPTNGVTYYGFAAGSTLSSLTVTTGNDAKYIVAYFYNGTYPDGYTYNDYLNSLQIEENNQATTYEAYNGTTYTFTFGQTVYGGHFDNKGNLVVTHDIVDMGSLNWVYSSQNGWFQVVKPSDAKSVNDMDMLCSCYVNNGTSTSLDLSIFQTANNLRVKDSNYTDADVFKTAVNGQKIVYELATPITLSIASQNIPTLSGENNIFSNCGDTAIEYFTSEVDEVVDLICEQPMPLHHYSLGEVEIGTWIDGSTLYEKTIQITSLSVGTATIQHGISNFDTLVSVSGRFTRADDKQSPISNVSNDTKSMVYASNFTDTSFVLFIGDNYQDATALTSMYLTVQYTKTT